MTSYAGPSGAGMTVLVTGSSAGIGYFVAEQLAASGAEVVLGCRDTTKAELAANTIAAQVRGARVRWVRLDLADPASLPVAARDLEVDRLDAVVLNAGVLLDGADRRVNPHGHELMFATNHLGHFALVHHLAPVLARTAHSRVVTVGSFAARTERLDMDDLQSEHDYQSKRTYGRSKLAQMLFGFELDRRLRASGATTSSVVAHPGGALDSLTPSRPPLFVRTPAQHLRGLPAGLLLHGKHAAAHTIVHATLDPDVTGGELWGPAVFGMRGRPHRESPKAHMTDPDIAAKLWEASATLTGVDPFRQIPSPTA
ncbi:SDR family NAD(P)-dependent oxidoreductase [Nocardia altamirensis]|uniref:SDR family NAD(P)-dependent oxidoreductase n=1 Tax=Nocardia altamirensis TaxID=472158 RepID=UPI00083FF0BA|nr:SDR family NAD(P)-dependent oxidoreductase [Nocardia altamirensis]